MSGGKEGCACDTSVRGSDSFSHAEELLTPLSWWDPASLLTQALGKGELRDPTARNQAAPPELCQRALIHQQRAETTVPPFGCLLQFSSCD